MIIESSGGGIIPAAILAPWDSIHSAPAAERNGKHKAIVVWCARGVSQFVAIPGFRNSPPVSPDARLLLIAPPKAAEPPEQQRKRELLRTPRLAALPKSCRAATPATHRLLQCEHLYSPGATTARARPQQERAVTRQRSLRAPNATARPPDSPNLHRPPTHVPNLPGKAPQPSPLP